MKPLTEEEKKEGRRRRNREASLNWYYAHQDEAQATATRRREENPTYAKDWYKANSEKVNAASRQWRLENPEKATLSTRASSQRWRARRADGLVEIFTDLEIFERDHWICQICFEPIDPLRKRRPKKGGPDDLLSVSLDHVVPLSKGGRHTRENVQASHLGCNIRKHASILEIV